MEYDETIHSYFKNEREAGDKFKLTLLRVPPFGEHGLQEKSRR